MKDMISFVCINAYRKGTIEKGIKETIYLGLYQLAKLIIILISPLELARFPQKELSLLNLVRHCNLIAYYTAL